MISAVIGVLVLAGGAWLLLDYRRTAGWIHGYYNTRPELKLRPRWFFWQFRPSETQATFLGVLLSLTLIALGAIFVANGLV